MWGFGVVGSFGVLAFGVRIGFRRICAVVSEQLGLQWASASHEYQTGATRSLVAGGK